MAAKPTTRELVEQMVAENPRVKAADIAERAGVSRERVRQILDDLGYDLDQVWKKRRGRK